MPIGVDTIKTSMYENAKYADNGTAFTEGLAAGQNFAKSIQDRQEQGMKLSQMAREQQDSIKAQSFRNDLNDSYIVDPNTGMPTLDKTKTPDLVSKYGSMAVAPIQQDQVTQQNQAALKWQKAKTIMDHTGELLGSGLADEPSYQRSVQEAKAAGYDVSGAPATLAGGGAGYIKQMQLRSLDTQQQLDQYAKQQGLDVEKLKAGIESQKIGIQKQDLALKRQELYGGNQDPGAPNYSGGAPSDPALLVPSRVPKAHQDKALGEIKELQNVVSIAKPSLQAFDQAAQEVRPMSGGRNTSMTAMIPGMESPGQKAWQGMANTTVKDVEGTARQAAFDSLEKNFKPQFGDSDATIEQKRQGWVNYLKSHSAAPTSKAYNIDLSKYPSTNIEKAIGEKKSGGAVQMRDPKGNIRAVPADQVEAALKAGGSKI